jgi:hypothetical protein
MKRPREGLKAACLTGSDLSTHGFTGQVRADTAERSRRRIEVEHLRRHLRDPVPFGTWLPCRAHGNSSEVGCECSTYKWRST